MIDPNAPLALSALLFMLGSLGVFAHRGVLSALLSIELMLCGGVLALIAFDRTGVGHASEVNPAGEGLSVMVLSIATAQAIVGLAMLIAVRRGTANADSRSSRAAR